MTAEMEALREKIAQANQIVFLGGAGVSTESGIPDFRSAHGLYHAAEGRSYEEMLSIGYFIGRTDAFWDFFRNVMLYPKAQPNPAHFALARLERQGKLQSVLTQNIDGLHQLAGSQRVLELHGTVYRNSCLKCHRVYSLGDVLAQRGTPHCTACGGTLRPDIVMYGEPLDQQVLAQAVSAVTHCDLLIVGGTSLVVHPAASLVTYRRHGTELVLINREETPYDGQASLVIRQNIAHVLDLTIPNDKGECV